MLNKSTTPLFGNSPCPEKYRLAKNVLPHKREERPKECACLFANANDVPENPLRSECTTWYLTHALVSQFNPIGVLAKKAQGNRAVYAVKLWHRKFSYMRCIQKHNKGSTINQTNW